MCLNCITPNLSRRRLLAGGLALAATASLAGRGFAQTAGTPVASPEEAIQRLKEGNERYVAGAPNNTDYSADRYSRSLGQQPFAAVVACSDSRTAPELIFDQAPGSLFVVRVAGNFLNEDGIASLEFAAAVLGIQAILVLGHTGCGAVRATITSIQDKELPPGHLPSLVNAIRPAVYDVMRDNPEDLLAAATRRNATLNAEKAASTTPILSEFSESGKIKSMGGLYDIATGKVTFL